MVNQNLVKRACDATGNYLKDSGWDVQKDIDWPKLLRITVRKHLLHNDVAAEENKDDLQSMNKGNRH